VGPDNDPRALGEGGSETCLRRKATHRVFRKADSRKGIGEVEVVPRCSQTPPAQ